MAEHEPLRDRRPGVKETAREQLKRWGRDFSEKLPEEAETWLDGINDGDTWGLPEYLRQDFIAKQRIINSGIEDVGCMEGLAYKFMMAEVDTDNDGKMSDEDAAKHEEALKSTVDAAANFMLNIGIVATLLLSIQMPILLAEAEPHPLVDFFAKKMCGTVTLGEDDYFRQGDSIAKQSIEINVPIEVLKILAPLYMFSSTYRNLLTVMIATKGYGHLTWWCPDIKTKYWFMNNRTILEFQDHADNLIPNFISSLLLYALLTRGPHALIAVFLCGRWLREQFADYMQKGAYPLYIRLAQRARSLK